MIPRDVPFFSTKPETRTVPAPGSIEADRLETRGDGFSQNEIVEKKRHKKQKMFHGRIDPSNDTEKASLNDVIAFTPTSKPIAASVSMNNINCNGNVNGHGPYMGLPPSQQSSASMISLLHRGSPIPFPNYTNINNSNSNSDINTCNVPTSVDQKSCQSMTSRTINALHRRDTFSPSIERNYATIYPRMRRSSATSFRG